MQSDRRESFRISVQLPCAWRAYRQKPKLPEIYRHFYGDQAGQMLNGAATLDQSFFSLLGDIQDRSVAAALSQLNEKCDLILHATCPADHMNLNSLQLSADGFALSVPDADQLSAYLGIHLRLPDGFNVIASATCQHSGDRLHGAFLEMPSIDRRRLQRFLLNFQKTQPRSVA